MALDSQFRNCYKIKKKPKKLFQNPTKNQPVAEKQKVFHGMLDKIEDIVDKSDIPSD